MKSIFVSMAIAGLIVSGAAIAVDNAQQYVDDFNARTRARDSAENQEALRRQQYVDDFNAQMRARDGQGFSASLSSPPSNNPVIEPVLSLPTTTSAVDPFPECVAKIKSKKELQILKGKVDLEVSGNPPFEMLANNSMPTKKEKVAISLWAIEHKRCAQLGEEWRKNTFPPAINAILDNTFSDLFFLAADLYAAKISYGDYAKGQVKIIQEAKVSMTAAIQQIRQQQQVENQRRDDSANQQQLMQRQQAEDKRRNELAEQQQALQARQIKMQEQQQRQLSMPPCSSIMNPVIAGWEHQQGGCSGPLYIPQPPPSKPTYNTHCTTDYFGNVNCSTSSF